MGGEVRAGRREGVERWQRKWHAQGRSDSRLLGTRARAERTSNMRAMSVTLEVSKLSGWLNADAPCRVERRACDMGRGAGRKGGKARGGGGASGMHAEGPTQGLGVRARAERTVSMARIVVTLEVLKLSGWLKAVARCRVEREGHAMRGEVRAGRREGVERWHRKRHAQGRPVSRLGGQGTRGAHSEHGVHVRDLGGVKAQRLVERRRGLPSRREGHAMRGKVRAGRPEGVRRRRRERHARGTPDSRLLGARACAERT